MSTSHTPGQPFMPITALEELADKRAKLQRLEDEAHALSEQIIALRELLEIERGRVWDLRQERDQIIERCAEVCEREEFWHGVPSYRYAAAIRALKETKE